MCNRSNREKRDSDDCSIIKLFETGHFPLISRLENISSVRRTSHFSFFLKQLKLTCDNELGARRTATGTTRPLPYLLASLLSADYWYLDSMRSLSPKVLLALFTWILALESCHPFVSPKSRIHLGSTRSMPTSLSLDIPEGATGRVEPLPIINQEDVAGASLADRLEQKLVTRETKDAMAPKELTVRRILSFAIPAIGIWLCNPLLSVIDTSSVGLIAGTVQQAALNPAVAVTDYSARCMVR